MNTTRITARFALPLVLASFLVSPHLSSVEAQEDYHPVETLPVNGKDTFACVDAIAGAYDRTCGFYGLQPLRPSLAKDPLFCGTECNKCCEVFTEISADDLAVLHTTCTCVQSVVLTGGLDSLGCMGTGVINTAYALGILSDEGREVALNGLAVFRLLRNAGRVIEGARNLRGDQLTAYLQNNVPAEILAQINLQQLSNAIAISSSLALTAIGFCDNAIEGVFTPGLINHCKETCDYWFPEPPLEPPTEPAPEPAPPGPGGGGRDEGPEGPICFIHCEPLPGMPCADREGESCEFNGVYGSLTPDCRCAVAEVTDEHNCGLQPNRLRCEVELCIQYQICSPAAVMALELGWNP